MTLKDCSQVLKLAICKLPIEMERAVKMFAANQILEFPPLRPIKAAGVVDWGRASSLLQMRTALLRFALICSTFCLVYTSTVKFTKKRKAITIVDGPLLGRSLSFVHSQIPKHEMSKEVVEATHEPEKDVHFSTTLEWFKTQYKELRDGNLLPKFLARGNMKLVGRVITEFREFDSDCPIKEDHIHDAIILALNEDRHEHAINIMGAVNGKYGKESVMGLFLFYLFKKLAPEERNAPLKHFLAKNKEAFKEKLPTVFKLFHRQLIEYLSWKSENPESIKLLHGLTRQPGLLTEEDLGMGVFSHFSDVNESNVSTFFTVGWKEAVATGLDDGVISQELCQFAVKKYQLDPSSSKAREEFLQRFQTKREMEKEHAKKNVDAFMSIFKPLMEPFFPKVLIGIILGYCNRTGTWSDEF